jgi:hypothetical protein
MAFSQKEYSLVQIRQFGYVLALLLIVVGSTVVWSGQVYGVFLLLVGGLVGVAFWRQWTGTRVFFSSWMWCAGLLAQGMTLVLLTLVYFVVLTPTAFIARFSGHRFLARGVAVGKHSYWLQRKPDADDHACEKQY